MSPIPFIGRRRELELLESHLTAVKDNRQGRLLSVRGRRQAGKSRLVTEFLARAKLPHLFFTASRSAKQQDELSRLIDEAISRSTLPAASSLEGLSFSDWEPCLRQLAATLPAGPAVIVLDEFPWLIESSPGLEGVLQKLWDRVFEQMPVLFILIGSDINMMEALTTYKRPLFGRAKECVVSPFSVADTKAMIGASDAAAAFDAQMVTGGYPRLCLEWRRFGSMGSFLDGQLSDENADLLVVGRNILSAEFPTELQARRVLAAIGAGERTNRAIADKAGVQAAPLARSLQLLREVKAVVAVDQPVSIKPIDAPRYRVHDPYLRFWLRFVEPGLADIARGRPDLVRTKIRESWPDYRGRAIEPLVRDSLERLASQDEVLGGAGVVGGHWTRKGDVEVDLVGVDRFPAARKVCFIGSIKWRQRSPFGGGDYATLVAMREQVPGASAAPVVAVSRSGISPAAAPDAAFGPADLLNAWQ